MRKEKELVALLRGIADLLVEESERSPEFASRLEGLLSSIPPREAATKKLRASQVLEALPDVYSEWRDRGQTEFVLWLGHQSTATLRGVIRAQDLDPTRKSTKWKDPEKLAGFIVDGLRARQARGSAFIGRIEPNDALPRESLEVEITSAQNSIEPASS